MNSLTCSWAYSAPYISWQWQFCRQAFFVAFYNLVLFLIFLVELLITISFFLPIHIYMMVYGARISTFPLGSYHGTRN